MLFFKRNRLGLSEQRVRVAEIFVTTSMITSSYNDGTGCGPMCVTAYFLAKCKDGEYYELFSGKKLEEEKKPKNGFVSMQFDTPYVRKTEPFKNYLRNSNMVTIDIKSLFDFK